MSNTVKPVVQFEQVCFSYGRSEVLHDISVTVNESDFVAVVGPNGGGKTTLIRLILGLIKPMHGTIRLFNGLPVETRHRVGYVPQSLHYDCHFPVRVKDVVRMGRVEKTRFGRFGELDDEAVKRALDSTHGRYLMNKPFAELSGGERQRVLLAQALVADPGLLLLDEPTANVDSVVEKELFELFCELNKKLPIIMVSHNLNVVTLHASHVLCVNRTAEMHELDSVSANRINSAEGTDLAVIFHNQQCPVHDASYVMKSAHKDIAAEDRK